MNDISPPKKFPVPREFAAKTRVNAENYEKMYKESLENPDRFWGEAAERLHWFKKWDKVRDSDFANAKIAWFSGGKLNVSYNCLDRHLDGPVETRPLLSGRGTTPLRPVRSPMPNYTERSAALPMY